MPVHGLQKTSLIVHWILLNCPSPARKAVNDAVSKQVLSSECLRKEYPSGAEAKTKQARKEAQLLMQLSSSFI